ncbi:metallophosphoesterase family protein [Tengunoibacter tsumagoiensis]|uniref:Phosphoesterase n=1 Tax=Tengunoibacter tsumagoiensis TaxID=2014871 RepID=A0A401ZZX3_9CHLR|nr:metallophosphoesterase family protein [Tengunoibacter tsumagoiensis]GCE12405.1 DeoR family transcriptional regulator [Tengunoibacter tsumagoiensis]
MKIAALYDIHGNLPALDALLKELEQVQPDLIVVGGDIVSGPMPGQTLQRLSQLGEKMRAIRGNADREVVMMFDGQPINRLYPPALSETDYEVMSWIAGQLTRSQRDFLATLSEQFVVQVEGLGRVVFCHATVRNDEELFTPITPEERLRIIFSSDEPQIVVCGHTHIQFERSVGKTRIINAGSVGMPYAAQPGAYWLLLSSEGYEFRYTAYNGQAAAQEILASGYPQAHDFAENNVLTIPTLDEAAEHFERIAVAYESQRS